MSQRAILQCLLERVKEAICYSNFILEQTDLLSQAEEVSLNIQWVVVQFSAERMSSLISRLD